jgi:N-acetylglucosaminyl-diphospho-decaprenol L-rhamnosyltransferase
MAGRPDITAVVVTFNSRPFVRGCLESLARESCGDSIKAVVIDNNSTDDSAGIARELPGVSVVEMKVNGGFAAAVNTGISLSQSEYVLLLNPDTVVSRGAIRKLKEYLDANADVACVSPQLLDFDGSVQSSCREFPGVMTIVGEFLLAPWMRRRFPRFDRYRMGYFDHRSLRDVDQPMASCMLLRRDVLDRVGPLDESLPIFFNDVDLCRRVKEQRFRIVFLPDAKVYHYVGASTRLLGIGKELEITRSMYRYFRKYFSGAVAYSSGVLLLLGYFLRSARAAALRIANG